MARGIRRAVRPFGRYELSVVYRMELGQPLTPYQARIPIEIALAEEADVDELVGLNPYHDRSVITGRMRAGARCFVARVDSRIIGFNWIAINSVRDDEFLVKLGPNEVYCLDARVGPEYRGNGVHTELLFAMLEFARQRGFAHAYTRVSAMHRDSWKTHVRLGWCEAGTTYFFQPHSQSGALRILTGSAVYPVEISRESLAA